MSDMKILSSAIFTAVIILSFTQVVGSGCQESVVRVPKPRAYPRVNFPPRHYVTFQESECPFTFQYPDYMHVVKREDVFKDSPAHPCWFDLDASVLGAKIHCSYYDINAGKSFDELVTDAFKIADQINQRANYMDEIRVANAHGVSGLLMEFSGSAASPLHFFLTDSTTHFLKASLYYQSKVIPDSLAPITGFLREDLANMINSLTFK
jgi:gliding motility-associated lipoprotein GldD